MEEAIIQLAAVVVTFVLGLVMNKPGYKKGKNVISTISKAFEDDQLTASEIKQIKELLGL
jgi:hypothetical protein